MMKKRIYVDVHILQTVPPSCINRDDTGAPKTAIYGGVSRARVSSQAWKKAVRDEFREMLPDEEIGIRTKRIVQLVEDELRKLNPELTDKELEKMATDVFKNLGFKIKSPKEGNDALFLMSKGQAKALAELAVQGGATKDDYKKVLKEYPSIDMALFGRMVAADPSLNYDAACQVAHAISTHAVQTEYDYFTAVDDMSDEDNAGAGHIGVSEFMSSTLYRYATVNAMELYRYLGKKTPEAVDAFISAFIRSMPTGKQNSFANRTMPCAIYIAIREDQPVNLVGAFEKAVPDTEEGFEKRSEKKLAEYARKLYATMISEPFAAYVTGDGLEELADSKKLDDVLAAVKTDLTSLLPDGEE